MSRQKTYNNAFASADAKLCEAFFDKLKKRAGGALFCVYIYIYYNLTLP